MEARKKVAIYIDYAIRIPAFKAAYDGFKAELFSGKEDDVELQDELQEDDVRFYWRAELQNPEVENFYFTKKALENDYLMKGVNLQEYFYNEEHLKKFIEDYSFNIYADGQIPNLQDIEIINIAQQQLFDIVLVDECYTNRKKSNTFFFLSKCRVRPQQVLFLSPGQEMNLDNYLAVWNPAVNPEQVNEAGKEGFLDWFKEIEKKSKENG